MGALGARLTPAPLRGNVPAYNQPSNTNVDPDRHRSRREFRIRRVLKRLDGSARCAACAGTSLIAELDANYQFAEHWVDVLGTAIMRDRHIQSVLAGGVGAEFDIVDSGLGDKIATNLLQAFLLFVGKLRVTYVSGS